MIERIEWKESAYREEKKFERCVRYGDYTDRDWYYAHSNYKQIVREVCKFTPAYKKLEVLSDLKAAIDYEYKTKVLPVYEAYKANRENISKASVEVENTSKMFKEYVEKRNKECEELKEELARVKKELAKSKAINKTSNEKITRLQKQVSNLQSALRQAVGNGVITNLAASVAGKVKRIATKKVVINVR